MLEIPAEGEGSCSVVLEVRQRDIQRVAHGDGLLRQNEVDARTIDDLRIDDDDGNGGIDCFRESSLIKEESISDIDSSISFHRNGNLPSISPNEGISGEMRENAIGVNRYLKCKSYT